MNSRSRFHKTIYRKDSPGPNVKQKYYCGKEIVPGGDNDKFRCYDRSDGYWKDCIAIRSFNPFYGNYYCFDHTNGKWEWPNWNERDFTPDNSHLTSIETDGRLYTSPSIRVQGDNLSRASFVLDAHTSVYSRDDYEEVRAPSYSDDDNEDNLCLSDRSIDRIKAGYYRPRGDSFESNQGSVFSRN